MHLRLPCSQLNHVPKHHLTGTALPTPNHSFHEEILPDSNFPDATWAHFLMPNHLSLEKDRLIPAATFFQVLVESDEVSSQPPPLPTEQSQFSYFLFSSPFSSLISLLCKPSRNSISSLYWLLNAIQLDTPHQSSLYRLPCRASLPSNRLGISSSLPLSANLLRVSSIPS